MKDRTDHATADELDKIQSREGHLVGRANRDYFLYLYGYGFEEIAVDRLAWLNTPITPETLYEDIPGIDPAVAKKIMVGLDEIGLKAHTVWKAKTLGLATRDIEAATGISASAVSRTIKKMEPVKTILEEAARDGCLLDPGPGIATGIDSMKTKFRFRRK